MPILSSEMAKPRQQKRSPSYPTELTIAALLTATALSFSACGASSQQEPPQPAGKPTITAPPTQADPPVPVPGGIAEPFHAPQPPPTAPSK